jgi:hypothetical protein
LHEIQDSEVPELMRFTGIVVVAAILGVAPGFAAEKHDGFVGTWKMDPERSESSQQDVQAATLQIGLTDTDLMIETSRDQGGKPAAFHEKLTFKLDGSESAGVGDAGVPVTGKVRWEGGNLVIETARNINDSTVTTLYRYILSPDRRTLTVEKTLSVQHGYQGRTGQNTGKGTDVFVRASK